MFSSLWPADQTRMFGRMDIDISFKTFFFFFLILFKLPAPFKEDQMDDGKSQNTRFHMWY